MTELRMNSVNTSCKFVIKDAILRLYVEWIPFRKILALNMHKAWLKSMIPDGGGGPLLISRQAPKPGDPCPASRTTSS